MSTTPSEYLPSKQTKLKTKKKFPTPVKHLLEQVQFDQAGNLPLSKLKDLQDIMIDNSSVLQDDLPGYNHRYGPVFASFQFLSGNLPHPQKSRMPSYGSEGERLYNIKCKEMIEKGVLKDPFELGIQPALINNSWLVKKPSATGKKWDQLESKDVRVLTAFDHLNKYIRAIPPEVVKSGKVYTTIAKWKVMGELDFRDMYWQIPFRTETSKDRDKLSYLAIRTAWGTKVYATAGMDLLGMDALQEELTDWPTMRTSEGIRLMT